VITEKTGSSPVAQLRRTISSAQIKALDVLRQVKSSMRPPPLPPQEKEKEEVEKKK
jgi:hypothetical protein